MKILAVSPSCLMYSKIFLRLEPLGIELIAAAARRAGHDVRLIDLQVEPPRYFERLLGQWPPDAIALSCNYLANVPEVIELARLAAAVCPRAFVFAGGHSASFIARDLLDHADGAIACVIKGEGEAARRSAAGSDRAGQPASPARVPGVVTRRSWPRSGLREESRRSGRRPRPAKAPPQVFHRRARSLCSIEFSRGCPWDCSFCSAWTFYGRSYRVKSAEAAADELAQIREPGVFIVDDVAFIQAQHGMAIGEAIARRGIKKQYYLETRGDVLLRNKEVFQFWKKLGLQYMFLGVEAIDEAGLKRFRKRVSVSKNLEAIEFARSLGVMVAINLIADPGWDRRQFEVVREWCLEIPDREYQHQYALPRNRDLADRVPQALHPGLPPLRHPARRTADQASPGRVLSRTGKHAGGAQPQAPRLVGRQIAGRNPGRQPGARPD